MLNIQWPECSSPSGRLCCHGDGLKGNCRATSHKTGSVCTIHPRWNPASSMETLCMPDVSSMIVAMHHNEKSQALEAYRPIHTHVVIHIEIYPCVEWRLSMKKSVQPGGERFWTMRENNCRHPLRIIHVIRSWSLLMFNNEWTVWPFSLTACSHTSGTESFKGCSGRSCPMLINYNGFRKCIEHHRMLPGLFERNN